MQPLRQAQRLAKFILVWLVLSIGVAIASPIIKPQSIELICSGSGAMKLLAIADDGSSVATPGNMLDCTLCAQTSAPPPVNQPHAKPAQPLAYAPRGIPATHIAERTAAPLPARGPPSL